MNPPLPAALLRALTPPEELPPWKDPRDNALWPKLSNAEADASGGADPKAWQEVLRLSLDLLTACGWDARVLEVATRALLHRYGTSGWLHGMRLWEELLRARWEQLGPPRAPLREGAARRYGATLEGWLLDERTCPSRSAPLRSESLPLLRALQAAFRSRGMGSDGLLERAADLLDEWPQEDAPKPHSAALDEDLAPPTESPAARATPAPQEAPVASPTPELKAPQAAPPAPQRAPTPAQPPPPPSSPASASVQPAPGLRRAPEGSSPAQIRKLFEGERKEVLALLEQVRALDPAAPFPYRIAREWAWAQLQAPAPADPAKERLGFGLPGQLRPQELAERLKSGDWAAVLLTAERLWPQALLWLDPHHASAQALRALGHLEAAEAVEQTVQALVGRVPTLERLCYVDGLPLAAEGTRAWLAGLRVARGPGTEPAQALAPQPRVSAAPEQPPERADSPPNPAPRPEPLGGEAPVERALRQATAAVADRASHPLAMAQLMEALAQSVVPRDRFRLKLAFAELLLRAGRWAPARAVLDELEACAQAQHLDQWEPPLLVELLRLQLSLSRSETPARPDALPRLQHRAAQLGALHLLI